MKEKTKYCWQLICKPTAQFTERMVVNIKVLWDVFLRRIVFFQPRLPFDTLACALFVYFFTRRSCGVWKNKNNSKRAHVCQRTIGLYCSPTRKISNEANQTCHPVEFITLIFGLHFFPHFTCERMKERKNATQNKTPKKELYASRLILHKRAA